MLVRPCSAVRMRWESSRTNPAPYPCLEAREAYTKQRKHWKFTSDLVDQWDMHGIYINSLGCCTMTDNLTRRRESPFAPSDSFQRNTTSVNLIAPFVIYLYRSESERERDIRHHEVVLGIASSFNWGNDLFFPYYSLVELFFGEDEFNVTYAHVEKAKTHVLGNHTTRVVWPLHMIQFCMESAGSKAQYPRLCARSRSPRGLALRRIQNSRERASVCGYHRTMESEAAFNGPDFDVELLGTALRPTPVDSSQRMVYRRYQTTHQAEHPVLKHVDVFHLFPEHFLYLSYNRLFFYVLALFTVCY